MRRQNLWPLLIGLAWLVAQPTGRAALDASVTTRLADDLRCQLGVYGLPGQRTMAITGHDGQPRGLQYTLSDGRFGPLQEQPDGSFAGGAVTIRFEPCAAGTLWLGTPAGAERFRARRLALKQQETRFTSDGITLHGKLVLPPGGHARVLAVWVEGSNNNPSTDDCVWPYELARRGVAVFVYDKRGTGASGGAMLSDFHARARDTSAAVREARRLAPGIRRVGVIGGSQGGWVAPLVATQVRLDFVVAAFALAEGPIAQDQALVAQQLHEAGFDDAAQGPAQELTALTEKAVRTDLREGLDELDAFKTRWAGAPWLKAIQPRSYTGLFLQFTAADIRAHGPAMAQGLNFTHEPRPVIQAIRSRQLWLLGGRDRQAPNVGTQSILRQLQALGRPIDVVVFERADHGLIEPAADGSGFTYAASLFDTTADWVLRAQHPARGRFITR